MTTVLQLDAIKELVDIPQLIEDIEAGFVLYSQGRVQVPPVGFLHFDDPPGDVHIKYGSVTDGESYVMKMASGFPNNVTLGVPVDELRSRISGSCQWL
jgi:ornithine cyclodeaminase